MPEYTVQALAGSQVSVSTGYGPESVEVGVPGRQGSPGMQTFGDLMKPTLPTRAPTSKVQASVALTFPDWDGIGPTYSWNGALADAVRFNGAPSAYSIYGLGVSNTGSTTPSYRPLDIEFMLTGNYAGVLLPALSDFGAVGVRAWVDNQEVEPGVFALPGVNYHVLSLKFAVYGTYPIRVQGGTLVGSVFTNKNGSIWKPGRRYTLGVVSDSMFEGMNGVWADTAAPWMRTLSGWNIVNLSQGGTGYVNPGAGGYTKFGSPQRLAALQAADIDALLVHGSSNDSYYTAAALEAEMKAYYDQVQTIKPNIPIVLVGPSAQGYFDPAYANLMQHVAVQKSIVAQYKNIVGYCDAYTEDWLTGTGNEVVNTNDGNQDWLLSSDSLHLSPRGGAYYAQRILENMRGMKAGV